MCNLVASLCFLLALLGHDGRSDGTATTQPPATRGAAVGGTTRIIAGILDRECVANGGCHYVLFPCDCGSALSGRHDGWRMPDFRSSIAGSRWISAVGVGSGSVATARPD